MGKRLTDEERSLRDLSERDFLRHYVAALRSLGFDVAHHYDSRFSDQGTKGVPDLTIVGHAFFFMVELKREKGIVSPEQHHWSDELTKAGVPVLVCRPSDWEWMMSYAERIAERLVPSVLRALPTPIKRPKKKRAKPAIESPPPTQP